MSSSITVNVCGVCGFVFVSSIASPLSTFTVAGENW